MISASRFIYLIALSISHCELMLYLRFSSCSDTCVSASALQVAGRASLLYDWYIFDHFSVLIYRAAFHCRRCDFVSLRITANYTRPVQLFRCSRVHKNNWASPRGLNIDSELDSSYSANRWVSASGFLRLLRLPHTIPITTLTYVEYIFRMILNVDVVNV